MNPNPYPQGRWTAAPIVGKPRCRTATLPTSDEPPPELLNAPLRELIWCLPESKLLEEAKVRIDQWVNAALLREAARVLEPTGEGASLGR